MPIECTLLDPKPSPLAACPSCDAKPFAPFMRGQVQRLPRSLFSWPPLRRRDYCAVICSDCKDLVGWESP